MRRWLRNVWLHYTLMGCLGRTVVATLVVLTGLVGSCVGLGLVADHTDWLDELSEEWAEDVREAKEADAGHGEAPTPRIHVGHFECDELREEEAAKCHRWREAPEHWDNIEAFMTSMEAVNADKVIDLQESRDLCYKAPQWRAHMEAAKEYVAAYREAEPETVAEYARIHKLETEADRAMVVVVGIEGECQ